MDCNVRWKALGWDHPLWDLLRYYRSLRFVPQKHELMSSLQRFSVIMVDPHTAFPVDRHNLDLLEEYLAGSTADLETALSLLRTEDEAKRYCAELGILTGQTTTRNLQHHQSSKALVASVTEIAKVNCKRYNVSLDYNPQRRCIWCNKQGIHVSARNLDGAIPGLLNPSLVWEIKEYWGVTSGGSKMSDAVYECHLVGRELRDFERATGQRVIHAVLLDGKNQWRFRKSDLMRFIDLFNQGFIDELFVGRDCESQWQAKLSNHLSSICTQ